MKTFYRYNRYIKPAFLAGLLLGATVAQAAIDISSTPLQTGSTVPPNILFILDDSGSMHFELLPENIIYSSARYMFPRANNIYGGNDYSNYVPTVADGEPYNAFSRSPQMNLSYYNPAITYHPWVTADGNLFPDANPACALHNPVNTTAGFNASLCRNLTQTNSNYNSNRWVRCTGKGSGCSNNTTQRTYWPATYFYYNGGGDWVWDNYTKVEIRPETVTYSGHGRTQRSDCSAGVCSYAQEIQNFANWYTYYRSRILTSRAGIGRAFVNQSEAMRVGFGTINKSSSNIDGISTGVIVRGVRAFEGSNRTQFYSDLYNRTIPNAGTPLRNALNAAGQYYSRTDSKGPWGVDPGFGSEAVIDHISCRQSFTILMTDGYYNDSTTGIGNQDNSNGSVIYKPNGTDSYQYTPGGPFSDSYSNTLADVAMKYWKTDLRPDLENLVPVSSMNEAFWQHMVTFGVGFGVAGSIDNTTAFNALNSRTSIDWPNPANSDSAKIDDLLHAAVNSRGGYFTASDPEEFAYQLERTLTAIIDRVMSASNLAGTTTSLQAEDFVYQGSFNSGEWSGSLKSYSLDNVITPAWESNFPAWGQRSIYFGRTNGTADIFTQANVNADGNALSGIADIVNYLRGDQTYESAPVAKFRNRGSLLGDIANSSPAYIAQSVNLNYHRYSWGTGYTAFRESTKTRTPMIYVGANDGMLHAFNASNGTEVFAYVPAQMLTANAALAEYAEHDYEHHYYVDGSPVIADVYLGGWKTIMLGSLGRGGDSLFAIDVTSPAELANTATGTGKILWDKQYPQLGVLTGKPVITRLNNNQWAVVVGYGYNNSTDQAGLLVISLVDGSVIANLTTAASHNPVSNGIGQLEGWDADGNGNTDWFFGGDLAGNVWKFDLSSSNPAEWHVAYGGNPLFTARDSNGNRQGITGGISLASHPQTGQLWVFFGTGQMLSDEDPLLSRQESWYGLKDGSQISNRTQLLQRSMTNVVYSDSTEARTIESGSVNDLAGKQGWYIDLNDTRERIVSSPQFIGSSLVVSTVIPGNNDCNPQGDGWVLAIDPFSGARLKHHFFDLSGDKDFTSDDAVSDGTNMVAASGVKFDGMPSEPLFFEDTMVVGLADTRIRQIGVDVGAVRGRISWRELDN